MTDLESETKGAASMSDLKSVKAIDIHMHPWTQESIYCHGTPFQEAARFFARSPKAPQYEWVTTGKPKTIDDMHHDMAAAGVEKAVILNMVAGHNWGSALSNDFIASYVRAYPDMFIGFAGIDPNMDPRAALREMERCSKELGLVGLKFHPPLQNFYPNDRKLAYPLYERAAALNMTILFHSGTTLLTRCYISPAKPEYVDQVAVDFPELRIVMSHFGWPWTDEAIAVVWRHRNVWLDLSGWLPRYIYGASPLTIHYMNTVLQDKICFGSDYPPLDPGVWLEDFRELLAEGYSFGGKKYEFRPGTYEKVVRLNALKALGIG